jgi:Glycosyltransferases involved in cell wall biogenesis
MSDCIPLFSVIIPLYNKEVSVSRAISSVLNQRFRGFELILVNDGSTDSSLEKVESFTDSRIRVISQFNQGVSAARNRGILESKCKYLAFLDADDEWSAEFLQEMKFLIEKVPGAGAYASGYSIQEEGGGLVRARLQGVPIEGAWGLVDFYIKSVSLGNSPVWSSAVCVPNTTFREVGMFPEGIRLYEDLHMWCRISLRFSIAYVNKALSVYHKEAENRAFCDNQAR